MTIQAEVVRFFVSGWVEIETQSILPHDCERFRVIARRAVTDGQISVPIDEAWRVALIVLQAGIAFGVDQPSRQVPRKAQHGC